MTRDAKRCLINGAVAYNASEKNCARPALLFFRPFFIRYRNWPSFSKFFPISCYFLHYHADVSTNLLFVLLNLSLVPINLYILCLNSLFLISLYLTKNCLFTLLLLSVYFFYLSFAVYFQY